MLPYVTDDNKYQSTTCLRKTQFERGYGSTQTLQTAICCYDVQVIQYTFSNFSTFQLPLYSGPVKEMHNTRIETGWNTNFTNHLLASTGVESHGMSHSCTNCGKAYLWKTNLIRHMKLEYHLTYEVPYSLSGSNKRFSQTKLYQTVQQQLPMITPEESIGLGYFCPNCGKGYCWKRNLKRHLSLECGKQPTQKCPYCPYVSKHKCDVKRHMNQRHRNIIL
ncbi:hypothetical protein ANN_25138 [Periplaneta americana]|uniref:C2H2-type domain-containing protein n=1 Tax=Periplaneta americana TaxID=6978 RepID=A0ABQ8S0U8_PERAM|nr:hypothetical protein ANN_25138 [Periplaneta americana]